MMNIGEHTSLQNIVPNSSAVQCTTQCTPYLASACMLKAPWHPTSNTVCAKLLCQPSKQHAAGILQQITLEVCNRQCRHVTHVLRFDAFHHSRHICMCASNACMCGIQRATDAAANTNSAEVLSMAPSLRVTAASTRKLCAVLPLAEQRTRQVQRAQMCLPMASAANTAAHSSTSHAGTCRSAAHPIQPAPQRVGQWHAG
ncbi:hypothetical protein COO60DRAFT_1482841 [Scenedesmus sp. NREL 46B-D3]|nr:hypothetical protein COO60DRAFT_1482841 [Scenedesmus sp. NREL 46B-D3]